MTDSQITALIAAVLMTSETHRYSTEEALRLAELLQAQARHRVVVGQKDPREQNV
jgi:hypothetical protein